MVDLIKPGAGAMPGSTASFLLTAEGIAKSYAGVVALADGNISVRPGEIHGLLGENGAGKSTLIKCLAGTPAPDSGRIAMGGVALPQGHSAVNAAAAGLAFIHQEGSLVETLSVEENVALAVGFPRKAGMIDWRAVRRMTLDALSMLGVDIDPSRQVAELPIAARTVVSIARALAQSARLVVLDEPTASVSPADATALFRVLKRMSASGTSLVFVSHRLDEVYAICDRVTILRDGHTAALDRPLQNLPTAELVELICGRPVTIKRTERFVSRGDPILKVSGLAGSPVAPLSFAVSAGEILGVTGLSDGGQYELGELLFGIREVKSGSASLGGKGFRPTGPGDALQKGMGYVPPDRNVLGLAKEMTLTENLFINPQRGCGALSAGRLLIPSRERSEAHRMLERFHVRPANPDIRVGNLSGGNAQKILVARGLQKRTDVLIVNDPTVGVDVGAREEIYALLRNAANQGTAIILITSDFEEVETLANRAFVMVRGVVAAELDGERLTQAEITAALTKKQVAVA
jgi:ribose transport system ATP-binding protein